MNFDRAADELRRQEFSRLAYAVTPRPEALRAMTADALRDEIAGMWERLGHTVINSLAAPEIVTIKGERKFVTMYANPLAPDATRSGAVWQLRDRVVDARAERGFYVSVRGFTPEAQQFAQTAPVQLIDGAALVRSLQRSRKGIPTPQSYKFGRHLGQSLSSPIGSIDRRGCPRRESVHYRSGRWGRKVKHRRRFYDKAERDRHHAIRVEMMVITVWVVSRPPARSH
jgi:hypothetical protein